MPVYNCDYCRYETTDKSNWNKHVKSIKHEKMSQKFNQKPEETPLNTTTVENTQTTIGESVILNKIIENQNQMMTKIFENIMNITNIKATNTYNCVYCDKAFTTKGNMKRHEALCSEKINNETKNQPDVLEMIDELKKTIDKNNKNTNIMGDLPPVTAELLKAHLEKLTLDFIQDGAKGYAIYASNYALKDCVICTDKSRKKLKFREENGNIVNDFGGVKITQLFFGSIKDKNKQLIDAEYNLLRQEVARIGAGGEAGEHDLTNVLERSTMLQTLLYQCNAAAEGKTNELTQAFVRHLTRAL